MNSLKHYILLTIFLLLLPISAHACIVRFRPSEELKTEASIVVFATVISRDVYDQSTTGELYKYKIKVLSVERGPDLGDELSVTYFNLRAHEVDGVMECFLKDGSGLETDLRNGQEYRFFLKSAEDKEILFSEVVDKK